jgi:hypothetical protein
VAPDTSLITIVDTGYVDLPFPEFSPEPVRDETRAKLTPDRRRTQRAGDRIAAGRHPLDDLLRLHPAAPVEGNVLDPASRFDMYRRPYTCGDCTFLVLFRRGNKADYKCGRPGAPMSFGPATTIRRWFPGCELYQPAPPDHHQETE